MLQSKRIFLKKFKPSMQKFCTLPEASVKSMVIKIPNVVQNVKDIVVTKYSKQTEATKCFMQLYLICGLVSFMILTYRDGEKSFKKLKNTRDYENATKLKRKKAAMASINKGCTKHIIGNIVSSIFFPFVLMADGIPALVYIANKEYSDY